MGFLATEFEKNGFLHFSNSSDQQQNQLYENLHSSYSLLWPILPLKDQNSPLRSLLKASISHSEPESTLEAPASQGDWHRVIVADLEP